MKLNYFKIAAALLSFGVFATGCNSDDLVADVEKPVEKDTQFYINVSIATPAEQSTRANDNISADDYEPGTENEQKINEILFVFYNTSNKYVGSTPVKLNNGVMTGPDGEKLPSSGSENNGTGSVETVLDVIVPVTVSSGSLKPAYVMAYINPTVNQTDDHYNDIQRSFEQSLRLTRTLEQVMPNSDSPGFTMTNSVYYDTTDNDWTRPKIAVEIPEGALYRTSEDAIADNNDAKKIVIFVERVVAKVTLDKDPNQFSITGNTIKDKDGVEYTLDFDIKGWGLSMLEERTFLIKNFRAQQNNLHKEDQEFEFTNYSESAIRNLLDNELKAPDWNMPPTTLANGVSGHRSFWAFSPHYYSTVHTQFPAYSDQIKDESIDPCLIYRSYDDIYDTKNNVMGKYGKSFGTPQYTLEHTMEASIVTNQQKRGVTCALVLGQYSLKRTDAENYEPIHTFYIRNGITSSGEDVSVIYPDDYALIAHVLEINNKIYTKNPEGSVPQYSPIAVAPAGLFEVKHPTKEISDGKYTPERLVAVQLVESAVNAGEYYLRDANGSYNRISTANENLDAANQALFGLMGGVEKYNKGLAQYTIPIEHLWGKDNTKIGNDNFNATLGQYGIVRNHLYNIKVKGIEGIGTGIGDPENPIVPNVEQEKYFVRTEIKVQRWRVVPQQNVTLRP